MSLAIKPRSSLDGQHFHVVVIGGGINGVAVARECAQAGKRTLLVEQNDFASGVTSRSTRIIHGGLRYLEHGELDLVRESIRERDRLLRNVRHVLRSARRGEDAVSIAAYLGHTIGIETLEPGANHAAMTRGLGGLPVRFPRGHWQWYAEPLAEPLTVTASPLGVEERMASTPIREPALPT